MNKMVGKQSVSFSDPPCILGAASICGPKEAEGPLADYFDISVPKILHLERIPGKRAKVR